jgi:hypothetical protein
MTSLPVGDMRKQTRFYAGIAFMTANRPHLHTSELQDIAAFRFAHHPGKTCECTTRHFADEARSTGRFRKRNNEAECPRCCHNPRWQGRIGSSRRVCVWSRKRKMSRRKETIASSQLHSANPHHRILQRQRSLRHQQSLQRLSDSGPTASNPQPKW